MNKYDIEINHNYGVNLKLNRDMLADDNRNEVAIYWAEYDMMFIVVESLKCCINLYHEEIGDHEVWLDKIVNAFCNKELIVLNV